MWKNSTCTASRPVRSDKQCVGWQRDSTMPGVTRMSDEAILREAESEDKRLNNLVAVTVVILTVFMAITKIKDDNINQAMQKAKADCGRRLGRISVLPRQAACRRERAEPVAAARNGRPDRTRSSPPSRPPNTKPTSRNTKAARRRRAPRPRSSKPNTTGSTSATTSSTCRTCSCRSRSRSRRSPRWSTASRCSTSPGRAARSGLFFGTAGFAGLSFRPEWLAQLLGT